MLVEKQLAGRHGGTATCVALDALPVLAHACLNALGMLRVGLETLDGVGGARVSVENQALLVTDVWQEIHHLERMASAMVRGVPPT